MSRNPVDIAVGAQIRALRQARHLTVEHVARVLAVEPSEVINVENGQSRASVDLIYHLKRLFDVPVSTFFDLKIDDARPRSKPHIKLVSKRD
jgi:transcriptional regulator with XRE-family HTH domain